jgi:hypothetical protein
MIEIKFDRPVVLKKIADAVVVLRNGEGFLKKMSIPARFIDPNGIFEGVMVSQRRLVDMDVTVGVPLFVISPREIDFSFFPRVLLGVKALNGKYGAEKKEEYYSVKLMNHCAFLFEALQR